MADKWTNIPDDKTISLVIEALKKNGIDAEVVSDKNGAKTKALSYVPHGAEIMAMTSVTLHDTGIAHEINETDKYNSTRKIFAKMDSKTHKREMKKIGAAPEYAIGSVHAVTHNGEIIVASNTGSQLPAYVYGSDHVIFVVGAQKIVKNIDEGMKRLYEHTLPLESERARKAYGVPGSNVSKVLVINKEVQPNRIKIIFVREVLGF